jgi:hypothetical protein
VSRSSTLVTIFGSANGVNVVATASSKGRQRQPGRLGHGVRDRLRPRPRHHRRHARAGPNAKIILLNPPNGAGMPYVADRRAPAADLQAISVRFSARPTRRPRAACWSSTSRPAPCILSNFSSDGTTRTTPAMRSWPKPLCAR